VQFHQRDNEPGDDPFWAGLVTIPDMPTNPWRHRARRALASRLPDGLRRNGEDGSHYVVCGGDPLTYRLVNELVAAGDSRVTVILPQRRRSDAADIAAVRGIRVLRAERVDATALRAAGLDTADALALMHPDDVANLHAALCAQEVNPRVRLVIRMFNTRLAEDVRRLFNDCAVLSDAAMATPAFVAAALGEVTPARFRLSGRTLLVARRADVLPQDVVCGLAVSAPGARTADGAARTADGSAGRAADGASRAVNGPSVGEPTGAAGKGTDGPGARGGNGPSPSRAWRAGSPNRIDVLPADQDRADVVLAEATDRPTGTVVVARRLARRRRRRWPAAMLLRGLRAVVNRKIGVALLLTVLVVAAAGVVLAQGDHLGTWDSFYATLLTVITGAQVEPNRSVLEQLAQVTLTLGGLALVPLLTAVVVDAVVNARLAVDAGQLRVPRADHVIVVGLGNVGTRVIRALHELGVDVVAIDKDADARGAVVARELKVPLIVGDAAREETLRLASVQTAQSLVALSTDDVTNLQAALNGRAAHPELRVVLRLFDGDFADRVQRAFRIDSSRSVSYLAAPAFAARMMGREVVATIPVERHVLLVAEVPVAPGSPLEGAYVSAAGRAGAVRVIGLIRFGEPRPHWSPPAQLRIEARDRLLVVARRAGLAWLLDRAAEPEAPALPEPTGPD
jgi:Trk K+ transport system NAD-binding subunit